MKKILYFALMFMVHFAVSLMFNWIFGESEHIGKMIISSVLFVLIYSALLHFISKGKRES